MSTKTITTINENQVLKPNPNPNPLPNCPVITDPTKSDRIIELYHNSAIKMVTASEDSFALNNKKAHLNKNGELKKPTTALEKPSKRKSYPEEEEEEPRAKEMKEDVGRGHGHAEEAKSQLHKALYPSQTAQMFPQPYSQLFQQMYRGHQYASGVEGHAVDSVPAANESVYNKNYELPTIASKMKQVAKNYFQNFTFRTIPFVPATSTSPSHNLGINIQQVLSIMKGRKPISGISPTLAYNIELAANKLGSRPFTALVSNLGSRLTNRLVYILEMGLC